MTKRTQGRIAFVLLCVCVCVFLGCMIAAFASLVNPPAEIWRVVILSVACVSFAGCAFLDNHLRHSPPEIIDVATDAAGPFGEGLLQEQQSGKREGAVTGSSAPVPFRRGN